MLSKEDIIGGGIGESREIEIPALGGAVRLREPTAKELSDFTKWQRRKADSGDVVTDFDVICQLGPHVMVNEDGKALFTAQEFEKAFAGKKRTVITELAKAIMDAANLIEPESMEKNSELTGTALRLTA